MQRWDMLCTVCGHEWSPFASVITRQKSGCPICNPPGMRMDEPAIVYYLRINRPSGEPLYKIGITNLSIKERYPLLDDRAKITNIVTAEFPTGKEAREAEQTILKMFRQHRYKGPKVLREGNTEIFKCDILRLDIERSYLL